MKSFLDRFRRNGPDDDDAPRQAESARDLAAQALRRRTKAASATPEDDVEGTTSASASRSAEGSAAAAPAVRRDETIIFTLGDFLPRIPTQLLTATEHDASMPLTFDACELSARIARGQTTIALSEIYQRAPKIFRGEIRASDNIEVRFPWQKLLDMVKGGEAASSQPKLTDAAAAALAQQLRTRKRNAPGAGGATAPQTAGAPRQPMWFSRPTSPATPATGALTEMQPEPKPAEPAHAPPHPTKLPLLPTVPVMMPAPAVMQDLDFAIELERITKMTEQEVERLRTGYEETIAELTTQRDEAREQLKTSRQSGAGDEEAATVANERDAQNSKLEENRKEIEALYTDAARYDKQLEQEKTHFTQLQKTAEAGLAAISKERDEARLDAESRAGEITVLQAELATLKQTQTAQIQALTAERDALDQQKQHFAEQAAALQKAESGGKELLRGEGERSQREIQRQTEELQRRITALESSQREVAQELTREREARIKAERTAAQADRARGEATALVESTRNDAKRELEALTRKREAELSKTQKELQEKLDAQLETHARLMKIERDALAKEREKLAAAHSPEGNELAALRSLHEKASSEAAALRDEQEKLTGQVHKLQLRLKATEERREAEQHAERETHAPALHQARDEAAAATKVRDPLGGIESAKSDLDQSLGALTQQRDAARKRVERLQCEIDELLAHPPADPAMAGELERTKAALAAAQQKSAGNSGELESLRAESQRQLAAQREENARKLAYARDEATLAARAQADKLGAAERARAKFEKDLAAARHDVEKLVAELTEARKRTEANPALTALLERTKSQVNEAHRRIEIMTSELDQQKKSAAARAEESEKALAERLRAAESALAAKDAEIARLRTEYETSHAGTKSGSVEAEDAIRTERDELAAELETMRERTKALLSKSAKDHAAALAAAEAERDAARRESTAEAQRLAEDRLAADQATAQHRREMEALNGQLNELANELARTQQAAERQSAEFLRELKAVTEQRDKAMTASAVAETESHARGSSDDEARVQTDRLTAERITRLERDVARMRRERDQLIEQRDELRDRIAGMADAQQRLEQDIDPRTTKAKPLPTDVVQKPVPERESNVIDIREAELLQPGDPDSSGVRPPQLRPMVIPPPNLRVL